MKKRVLGSFLMIVLMITMVFGFVPTKANAAVKYYYLNNEIKLITDTSLNKVLKEGDQYKVEISVSDYGISNPTSAAVYEYNTPYDLGYGADAHSFDATSFRHDEVNHCYIVTLDRTVSDEATGYWYTMGVEFKNDSGISYATNFSRQVMNNYIHYVWKPLNQELLVINRVSCDFVIGEKLQLKAMLLPSLQEVLVEWSSSDESIATVDSNGLVTSKKVGKVTIKAKYNGMEHPFYGYVYNEKEDDYNNMQLLNNRATIISNTMIENKIVQGDQYSITFSVKDDDIEKATSVSANIYYKNEEKNIHKNLKAENVDLSYDSVNRCYIVTIHGSMNDVGDYEINDLMFKNDRNQIYCVGYYKNYYSFTVLPKTAVVDNSNHAEDTTAGVSDPTTEVASENTTTAASNQTNETSDQGLAPQTGDSYQPVITSIVLLAVSASVILLAVFVQKKKMIK